MNESHRSSRELSPGRYNDIGDDFRGGINRERRRSNPDTRTNQLNFNTKRELFRESMSRDVSREFSREPPRGPKGVPDAPTGPRASSYGDFRSDFSLRGDIRSDFTLRGDIRSERGRGRGHGWRDDGRERAWDLDREYRDRRDERFSTTFRDDRGRDRWGSRDSYSSSRRPFSPQGRGRSPNYGQREIREPSISDLERTKRGSRDGLLSSGIPSSDIAQPLARAFVKGRSARGRARTSNYDEYHRLTGPNRSPIDAGWNRRTQPSATPPPPVPAFGSTSSSIQIDTNSSTRLLATANSSVTNIVVPTAPRSERRPNKITTPTSAQTPTEHSRRDFVDKQLETSTSSVNRTSCVSSPISTLEQYKVDHGLLKKRDEEALITPDSNKSPHINLNKVVSHTHEAYTHQVADKYSSSSRKRRSIIIKGLPMKCGALSEEVGNTSDSDSGDDFGDEYFEKEIARVKAEIDKISHENPFLPQCEPQALFLNAFIESDIWDIIETTEFSDFSNCQKSKFDTEIQSDSLSIMIAANDIESKTQISESKPNVTAHVDSESIKLQHPENLFSNTSSEYYDKQNEMSPKNISQNTISVEKHSNRNSEPYTQRSKKATTNRLEGCSVELSDTENVLELEAVRKRMKTPPITSLPRFNCKRWYENEEFLKSLEPNAIIGVRIYRHLAQASTRKKRDQEKERRRWASRYHRYRRFTDRSNDPAATRSRERFLKSQVKSAAEAAASTSVIASASSKPEGSRRIGSRFATEHELQRVLLQSEKEAKESKEQKDRVVRASTATAKEAMIPDMLWDKEEKDAIHFEDRSGLVSFERSFARLEFGEPIDNFTKEETSLFEKSYFEFPKQWGKIAETLPARDYKSCIQHYYLVKHPSSLKKKLKDQSRKRKGRQPKTKKEKTVPLINDLGSIRDEEEPLEGEADARSRRPRRAAAPTFNSETKDQAIESDVAFSALSPAKKLLAVSNNEQNTDAFPDPVTHKFPSPSSSSLPLSLPSFLPLPTATKRKAKTPRDKPTKQVKSSQSLSTASKIRKPDSPIIALTSEWKLQPKPEASPKTSTENEKITYEQQREEQLEKQQQQSRPVANSHFHHEHGHEYQLKTVPREVPLYLHREQQSALLREKHNAQVENQMFLMKQENISPKLEQHEAFTSYMHTINCSPPRKESFLLAPSLVEPRRSIQGRQFQPHQPRFHHSISNSVINESHSGDNEEKQSSKQVLQQVTTDAITKTHGVNSSSCINHSGVRKPEIIRKTSNIMSLLNEDEPGEARPLVKQVGDTSLLHKSQTTSSYPLLPVSSYPSKTTQASSQHRAPALPLITQVIPQPYVQSIHQFSHQIPQNLSPIEKQSRSYVSTPGKFENQGYVSPSVQPQSQKPYQQHSKQTQRQPLSSKSPTPIHRETSRNDIHTITNGYSCSPVSSSQSSTSRLKESSYSKNPSSPLARQPRSITSPIDLTNTDLEYYGHQHHSTTSISQLKILSHQTQQQQQYQHHYQHHQKQQQTLSGSSISPSAFRSSGALLQNQNSYQQDLRHTHVSHSETQPLQQQPRSKSVGQKQLPHGNFSHNSDNENGIANQSRQYFSQLSSNSHSKHSSHINQDTQEPISVNRRSRRSSFESRYDAQLPTAPTTQNSVPQINYLIPLQSSISSVYSTQNQNTSPSTSLDAHHTTQHREVTDNYIQYERRLQDEHFHETRARDQERDRERKRNSHSRQ
ncbi:putative myb-like dna-binding domain-containing protein [Erysiphe neolycopersici]|uniref:Putative myb-like dna-binding domain-containing protein n=1 Tax=Erysiphe neolycopersici TaxID=212602 RepID=A0A420HNJ6_9PEZI|nr:putative myb-like dna-binding domain-containing protein [Erysiphe neolycopersici]